MAFWTPKKVKKLGGGPFSLRLLSFRVTPSFQEPRIEVSQINIYPKDPKELFYGPKNSSFNSLLEDPMILRIFLGWMLKI